MAVQDRTNQPFESVKHEHPHGHPRPVPHLRAPGESEPADDHGSEVEHAHVHQQGGGRTYDHHLAADGHDSATTSPDDLKSDPAAADDSSP